MGRFLSVDPVLDLENAMSNPQYWNRYAYVRNNPLRFSDPTGKYACEGKDCATIRRALSDVRKAASNLTGKDRAAVIRVLSFYGRENDHNGVTVKVGSGIGVGGTSTGNGRTTVRVDLAAEAQVAGGQNSIMFRPEVASTMAHEGQHGIDELKQGMPDKPRYGKRL